MSDRDKKDPDTARKKLVDAFASIGVMPVDLEKYLGHGVGQCTPTELRDLRTMYTALRDGESKWSDYVVVDAANRGEATEDLKNKLLGEPIAEPRAQKPKADVVVASEPAPVREPQPPKSVQGDAGSKAISEVEKLRQKLADDLTVYYTQDGAETWIKENFQKSLKELTKDDLKAAIEKINKEMDAREGMNVPDEDLAAVFGIGPDPER